ncbi:MAG: hypothetical protein AAF546_12120 [Verrucomicrobiota bacterium]
MFENELKPIFEVKDCFKLTDRGTVLIPGIPAETKPPVRVGDSISLVTPEKKVIEAKIKSLELVNYAHKPEEIAIPICLGKEVEREDIPKGTKVYLRESNENQDITSQSTQRR